MLQSFLMNELIDELLKQRGVVTDEEKENFLSPDYDKHMNDPFLLKDMDKAVKRIIKAIDKKEHIAIYSDFDADGIPGGALLHDVFEKVGHESFTNYIPHRNEEGYGFHKEAVKKLKKKGVTLIITVDVGIADIDTAKYAKRVGLDLIITDHHLPSEKLPTALAVINPQQEGETYPFKDFCGTGVAFKLTQALFLEARKKKKKWMEDIPVGWEKWLLDLVAIATVADMMPLVGENRVLVHYGLRVLRKSRRPGIGALARKLGLKQPYLTEDDIGFSIGPRINAASRMGDPEKAFELLTTHDDVQATALARELESLNNKRKGQVASIVRGLNERFKESSKENVLVAGNPNWNPSLLGLAANSLVDTHKKTACLWGRDGTGSLKGSCRGNSSVNIVEMFRGSGDALSQFGGHEHAGGFAVEDDKIHTLEKALNKSYKKIAGEFKRELAKEDAELDQYKIRETHSALLKLSPFGIGNTKPIFVCKKAYINSVAQFGKEKNHFEMKISKEKDGQPVRAISFFKTHDSFTTEPKEGGECDVFCTIELSRFAGRVNFELRIVDIR